jgi:hypothetical protein
MPRSRIADRGLRLSRRWLDMDDYVDDLWESGHQLVLDDMRCRVRGFERRLAFEPDVEINEYVIGRAAGANVM